MNSEFDPRRFGIMIQPLRMEIPDTIPTRWTLVQRLKDWEDQASWLEFFDTYWRLIFSVAIQAGLGDIEAQEVVQETVIAVAKGIKRLKAYPARGSFKGWLLHTARWKIADQFTKRKAPPRGTARACVPSDENEERLTSTVDGIPDPAGLVLEAVWDAEWEANLRTAALARVRARVDPLDYQIFDLCVLRGAVPRTVAAKLGVKPWKVYFARKSIARFMERELRALRDYSILNI